MDRPNIAFIFADQFRYQACGYAGDPHRVTPNLDHLAGQSVNFHQAVSLFPHCTLYRASLFTGVCAWVIASFSLITKAIPQIQ